MAEHRCGFSFDALKDMQKQQAVFYTARGKSELRIAEVYEAPRAIRMLRSTGKLTAKLDFDKLAKVHELVHEGKLALDPEDIDKELFMWGNYVRGLFRHFGCN